MGLTPTSIEIAGGEVSEFVAEHLEKNRNRRGHKIRGEANNAMLEMDPPQGSAKPSTPLDSHAVLKTFEPPAPPPVSQQALNIQLDGSADSRCHAQEADTLCDRQTVSYFLHTPEVATELHAGALASATPDTGTGGGPSSVSCARAD
jgi:hypothetical protein